MRGGWARIGSRGGDRERAPAKRGARGRRPLRAGAWTIDSYFRNNGKMDREAAIGALGALAQETRLDVFRLLIRAGRAGMPAGAIAARLELAPATLSFHLAALRHAGLVEARREGRQLFYGARPEALSELMGFLMENCCQGHPEACAFLAEVPARPARR